MRGLAALSVLLTVAAFFPALRFMMSTWGQVEEYSYGYFVPLVTAYLIWQLGGQLRERDCAVTWSGLWLVVLGLLMGAVGSVSAIRVISQYGFVVTLVGLAACWMGWLSVRLMAAPLAILALMIPLPQFLLREMSERLELMSSQLGVAVLRALDVSVYLEGNVIDLGNYKLQVVEACSGLRYLLPLLVLGVIAAYLFRAAAWKRIVLVVSTLPMTLLMNSLRIALIGVTVDRWGIEMAEGLLHEFEGFTMFMMCTALLAVEMAVLARIGDPNASLRSTFGLEPPPPIPAGARIAYRSVPLSAVAGTALVGLASLILLIAPSHDQIRPQRQTFAQFPLTLPGGWEGRTDVLEPDVASWLAVDDYLLVNYGRAGEPPINLYSAYYATQSGGASAHSPRTCIPGGGWAITAIQQRAVALRGASLPVNRAMIERDGQRQLVYYWFEERGRHLVDELQVKWYILYDGVARNRSDGALVRLVTPLRPNEPEDAADRRLARFLENVQPRLRPYLPD